MDKTQEKLNNLLDLLAMRSCQPLSYTEELELNHLLDEFPEYTPDYFEPIAALADSTMFVHDPKNLSSMPESIQKKIIKNFRSQNAESKTLQIFKNIFQK